MKTIKQADMKGKRVLVRVDFNVSLKDGKIESDNRIREAIPTIQYLLKAGAAKIILVTHFGRPEGKVIDELKLQPVADRLAELLGAKSAIKTPEGYQVSEKIELLENIRFNPGEEPNDPNFAKKLAQKVESPGGEPGVFINDAFGTSHRAHASTVGVTKFLPSFAGFLMEKEIQNLTELYSNPKKPFCVILGGAKISDKIGLIKNLIGKVDYFLIGGAMANVFLRYRGYEIAKSLVEKVNRRDLNIIWHMIMDDPHKDIFLPEDVKVSQSEKKAQEMKNIDREKLVNNKNFYIVDIGRKTIQTYQKKITQTATIFWNGTMGIAEIEEFCQGTKKIAQAIAKNKGIRVIAGGDTVSAIESFGLKNRYSFVSTGGGATLEFLAGKRLPGIEALG